jgi:hypothetical protein
MKPLLKAPGSKLLKLQRDKLLSSFAFNFNLRRCTTVTADTWQHVAVAVDTTAATASQVKIYLDGVEVTGTVGRCRLTVSKPELKARLVSALETEM